MPADYQMKSNAKRFRVLTNIFLLCASPGDETEKFLRYIGWQGKDQEHSIDGAKRDICTLHERS